MSSLVTDRWNLLSTHSDDLATILKEYMRLVGIVESVSESISTPFLSSWVYVITRICECLLGITNIEGDSLDQDLEQIEGVSADFVKNLSCLIKGQVYDFCRKEMVKFDINTETSGSMYRIILRQISPSDPALAQALAGVCEYISLEMMELSGLQYRDYGMFYNGVHFNRENALVASEVKAWKSLLDGEEGLLPSHDDDSTEHEEILKRLNNRYGLLSWMYVNDALSSDDELRKFWKALKLDFIVDDKPKEEEQSTDHDTDRQSMIRKLEINRLHEIRKPFFQQYGASGMAATEELSVKLSPFTLQEYLTIALTLPPVDRCGRSDGDICSDHEELLEKVRAADMASPISINIDVHAYADAVEVGAGLLQLLTAVCYKVHLGAIEKICCIGKIEPTEDTGLLQLLLELFPDITSIDEIEWEGWDGNFKMFGERMVRRNGNSALLNLVIATSIDKFVCYESLCSDVDDSYVSADVNGLSDEDLLGEFKPVHIAAYNSDVTSLKALIEKLHANVDARAYDGSTALICAIVNQATEETVQYLIDRGAEVNTQIFKGPGWQSYMTNFSGFTPLMMAVNKNEAGLVNLLLKSGKVNTELYTGPISGQFPISSNSMLNVIEYPGTGFCFNALHIASVLDRDQLVSSLLKCGHANPDARVALPDDDERERLYIDFDNENIQFHPLENKEIQEALRLGLNTPLHLCPQNSSTAEKLINHSPVGASLLAQNISLVPTWKHHQDKLEDWLGGKELNLRSTVLAVCRAKNIPDDCSLCIIQFYVSMHLAEHFQRSYQQEMSDNCWPWMALSLTYRFHPKEDDNVSSEIASSWSIHRDALRDAILSTYTPLNDKKYDAVKQFVSVALMKVKHQESQELDEVLTHKLYKMDLFAPNNEDNSEMETSPVDSVKRVKKRPRF